MEGIGGIIVSLDPAMPEGGQSTLGASGILTLCHLVGSGILSLTLERVLTNVGI